ncbi:hypothetical protein BH09PLA1_BH09PLA1_01910 [soil metagenome]
MSRIIRRCPAGSRLAATWILAAASSAAWAQTPSAWLSPINGNWTDASRWSTDPNYPNNGTPPGTNYIANIAIIGAPYTVSLNDVIAVSTLNISSGQATLAMSGGTFSVTTRWTVGGAVNQTGGAMNLTTGLLTVADLHGNAVYNHSGGTLNFGQYFEVGVLTNDNAQYNVSNTAQVNGGTLLVGANFGTGTLTQTGGLVKLSTQLDIADGVQEVSTGIYNLSAGTLQLTNPGTPVTEFIGAAGNGTFNQTGGFHVMDTGPFNSMVLGADALSTGTYLLSGGTLQSAANVVGFQGSGTFLQSGGTQTIAGVMRIGRDSGGVGYFGLSGTGVLVSNGQVNVGSAGFGTFVQSGGNYTVNAPLIVSSNPLSRGRYTMSGGTLTVASEVISSAGIGTFEQSGGLHRVLGQLQNTTSGSGTYLMSGGTLNANSYASNGTLIQSAGVASFGAVDGSGTIAASGTARLTGNFIRHSYVSLAGNATIAVRPNGADSAISLINTLSFAGGATPSGTLDLANNDLKVSNGNLATIQAQIRSARNGGLWNQPGISSSAAAAASPKNTTLGLLSGAEYKLLYDIPVNPPNPAVPATFDGYLVAPSDVLVKYTWYGDTDFNGVVNFDDYSRTDAGFNNNLTGWLNGDFDYSGVVNFDDYSLIDLAFNTQSGTLRRAASYLDGSDRSATGMDSPSLQLVQEHFTQFGESFASSFLNAVPEPSSLFVFGGFIAFAVRLRRRARV